VQRDRHEDINRDGVLGPVFSQQASQGLSQGGDAVILEFVDSFAQCALEIDG
jgi:hypothetical protein